MRSLPPAVVVIGTAILDPLNVISATDRASQDIFFRYVAPLYGMDQVPYGKERLSPITVVILDDHFVESVRASWPVPHRTLTFLLQAIYCHAPKAVFFDLLFSHEHSAERQTEQFIDYLKGGEALGERVVGRCAKSTLDKDAFQNDEDYEKALQDLRARVLPLPPVYIGDLAPQKDYPVEGGSSVFQGLIDAGVRRLPTNWVADHGDYPLVVTLDDEAAFGGEAPAQDSVVKDGKPDIWQDIWPQNVDGRVPSAALALYADLGHREFLDELLRKKKNDEPTAKLVASQREKLIVEWGFYPRHLPGEAMNEREYGLTVKVGEEEKKPYLQLRRFPDGCTTRPTDNFPSWLQGWWPGDASTMARLGSRTESVWQFLQDTIGILNANSSQPRQACPYNQWVPGEAVLAARTPEQMATLGALFEGRVVMIGADIKGAPDLVLSPVHGQIPGVFLHAMALDNLIALGPDGYWRPMPTLALGHAEGRIKREYPWPKLEKAATGLLEITLLLLIFAISEGVARWQKHQGERWPEAVYAGVELLGHMTLVFGTVALLASLAFAPMNWLGLTALAVSKDVLKRILVSKAEGGGSVQVPSRFANKRFIPFTKR
ncbi:MAG: CHASE2 domain-containing protein [Alphaproteobacteria bacterium]